MRHDVPVPLHAPHRQYALSLPIVWKVCTRQRIPSGSSLRFLSLLHYDDTDYSELEDKSNESTPYVFWGEAKFVRERYIRVAASVIVIIAGTTNICV